ncbi:flagellar hook-basal body complex protein [Neptunomonas marina]|uniref:Flagellar hook protein FlgE n=1 Tax=Neptunomonas marina TaxID=1815562 RepID=A0A437Q6U2_9GAMM|nr:flagellar hook-basal body complex protein [Neptunomonas marina]RVU30242.1 flagellar hook-basal body complex protein [Neptunomonas marina]
MAGFNTAVTGLKASSTMLDVTGNNIANSSTIGYKTSRTEFGDIYTASVVGAGSSNTPGSGVTVSDIAQDFSAGTLEFTNNNLDLAINGSGFFQLNDGQGGTTYTRAGAFELNKDGFIVSKNGKFLQGYGLDDRGNRLPIGNLAVTEKEFPPKTTETMDLSFNIDSREDANTLLPNYDKDKAGSFTYSTTVRTFDSLGNEHTIKYNFAEQRPENEYSNYQTTPGDRVYISGIGTAADTDGMLLPLYDESANGDFVLKTATAKAVDNGQDLKVFELGGQTLADLQEADPRIKSVEYRVDDAGNGTLRILKLSDSREFGDLLVTDNSAPDRVALTPTTTDASGFVSSNEKHFFEFQTGTFAANEQLDLEVAGVEIAISTGDNGMTSEQVALAIRDRESDILEANPDILSVSWDPDQGANGSLRIEFKPDVNPANLGARSAQVIDDAALIGSANQVFIGSEVATGKVDANYEIDGDNSYNGVYLMYAYLNGEEALDIGKLNDAGTGTDTEPGPILVKFNPENGLLTEINGEEIRTGATTPEIIIKGADPANKNNNIALNIGGSTQFASESIIKASDQDGYAKGDLIGVSFGSTGEMIASFSNGEQLNIGIVAVATFENQSGLQPSGDTEWTATLDSGSAILNPPGAGLNGLLRSASLEQSNVDLSAELVKLIEAQRNFQANSKTLETLNTVTQSILQI